MGIKDQILRYVSCVRILTAGHVESQSIIIYLTLPCQVTGGGAGHERGILGERDNNT